MGTEQLLRQRVLLAGAFGVEHEPVRVERIGLHLHLLVCERNADLAAGQGDALVDALAARPELACDVFLARYAALGQVLIQLERKPAHGRLGSIGMALAVEAEGLFQLALADEAPGSNHVGNDIYLQFFFVHVVTRRFTAPGKARFEIVRTMISQCRHPRAALRH